MMTGIPEQTPHCMCCLTCEDVPMGCTFDKEHGTLGDKWLPGKEVFDVSPVGDFMMSAFVPSA